MTTSAPSRSASSRLAGCAVSTITAMSESVSSRRIVVNTSSPVRRGIIMSRIITSGRTRRAISSDSSPSSASKNSYGPARLTRISSRSDGSSSQISTVARKPGIAPWKQITTETHRATLKKRRTSADFCLVAAPDLPEFDPRVIERFVESAYRRANAIFVGCVTAGVMLGAAFGATPLTPLGAGWPIPAAFGFATMLLGAFLGAVIGYVVGDTRSALCRLQGQTALAQVESAKNARAMVDAMQEIHEIHERIRELAAPHPPQPITEPEPVAPPPPPLPFLRVAGEERPIEPPPVT